MSQFSGSTIHHIVKSIRILVNWRYQLQLPQDHDIIILCLNPPHLDSLSVSSIVWSDIRTCVSVWVRSVWMMIGASPPMFIVTKERGVGRESWPSLEFSHHFVSKVMAAAWNRIVVSRTHNWITDWIMNDMDHNYIVNICIHRATEHGTSRITVREFPNHYFPSGPREQLPRQSKYWVQSIIVRWNIFVNWICPHMINHTPRSVWVVS